jgi:hypothetical protein
MAKGMKSFVAITMGALVLFSSPYAQAEKKAQPQSELTPEQAKTQKRAQDYADGKIVCKRPINRSSWNQDRYAEIGSSLWMWSEHCEYVK